MSSLNKTQDGNNAFKLHLVSDNLSHLMGEILTIVDASIEGDKNKAVKDLIKSKFSEKHVWFADLAWKELEEDGCGHMPAEDWEKGLYYMSSNELHSYKQ
jgi:hypothetical protein